MKSSNFSHKITPEHKPNIKQQRHNHQPKHIDTVKRQMMKPTPTPMLSLVVVVMMTMIFAVTVKANDEIVTTPSLRGGQRAQANQGQELQQQQVSGHQNNGRRELLGGGKGCIDYGDCDDYGYAPYPLNGQIENVQVCVDYGTTNPNRDVAWSIREFTSNGNIVSKTGDYYPISFDQGQSTEQCYDIVLFLNRAEALIQREFPPF